MKEIQKKKKKERRACIFCYHHRSETHYKLHRRSGANPSAPLQSPGSFWREKIRTSIKDLGELPKLSRMMSPHLRRRGEKEREVWWSDDWSYVTCAGGYKDKKLSWRECWKKKFNVQPNLLKIKFDCFHLSSVFTDYDDDNEINRTKRWHRCLFEMLNSMLNLIEQKWIEWLCLSPTCWTCLETVPKESYWKQSKKCKREAKCKR